jgi:hypothetical protein
MILRNSLFGLTSLKTSSCCSSFPRMPSSYQVALWKQERFLCQSKFFVQRGLIPHMRIESNVRFSKHLVLEWLRERSFQPRPVNRNGAKRP